MFTPSDDMVGSNQHKLMGEIGLMAVNIGYANLATEIFLFLAEEYPNAFLPKLGSAAIAIQNKSISKAMEILIAETSNTENAEFAHTFICLYKYLFEGEDGFLRYANGIEEAGEGVFRDLVQNLKAKTG